MSEEACASLALALSGFAVTAATENSGQPVLPRGTRHSRLAAATASAVRPLIEHAKRLVSGITASESADCQQHIEQLETLAFALRSSLGLNGRLPEDEEQQLWQLSVALWDTSLHRPERQAEALASLAKELFELIDTERDKSEECASFISFFAQMAAAWAKLKQPARARWCIERAMCYSEQLEGMLHSGALPVDSQEQCVVQLFNLYIEAANNALESKQQALANNLMSRAVQLSRHDAVSPDSAVSMCISITQLQLQQAHDSETMLAAALLTGAYQQLVAAEQHLSEVKDLQLQHGVQKLKQEVLLHLCSTHLQAGDAKLAARCLENAGLQVATSLPPDMQLMVLRVNMEAGKLAEALQFLLGMMDSVDFAADNAVLGVHTWMEGLRLVLPTVTEESLPAIQSVVSRFVWKAASQAKHLLELLQTLLADPPGQVTEGRAHFCQRMALEILAMEEVVSCILKEAGLQRQCHALLWHKASQLFSSPEVSAAVELFSAAFQYAAPAARAKTARMLAACYAKLGQHQRAVEYLTIAAKQEEKPTCTTQLMCLQAYVNLGNSVKALEVIASLPSCSDFHHSCLETACAIAAAAADPLVPKEAAAMATRVMIEPDCPTSTQPAGEEAELVLGYASAICRCLKGMSAGASATAPVDLLKELAAVLRLATKRINLVSKATFAGSKQEAVLQTLASHGYTAGMQAYQCKAYEQCVMLMSSSCVMLRELDNVKLAHGSSSSAQQATALMLATRAVLDLHACSAMAADRASKLLLAHKLLGKVRDLVADLPLNQHTELRHCYHSLRILAASRQPEEAGLVHAIEEVLQEASLALPPPRCQVILEELSQRKTHTGRLRSAVCSLVVRSMQHADGAAEGLQLAADFAWLCPGHEHLRQLVQASCQLLRASTCSNSGAPWSSGSQLHVTQKWLATKAWNAGVHLAKRTEGGAEGAALMQLAVDLLQARAHPQLSALAERMQQRLAEWRKAASVHAQPCPGDLASLQHAAQLGEQSGLDGGGRSLGGQGKEQAGAGPTSGVPMEQLAEAALPLHSCSSSEPSAAVAAAATVPTLEEQGLLPRVQAAGRHMCANAGAKGQLGKRGGAAVSTITLAEQQCAPPEAASAEAVTAAQPPPLSQPPTVSQPATVEGTATSGSLCAPVLPLSAVRQGSPTDPLLEAAAVPMAEVASNSQSSGELSEDSQPDSQKGVSWLEAIDAARRKCEGRQAGAVRQQQPKRPASAQLQESKRPAPAQLQQDVADAGPMDTEDGGSGVSSLKASASQRQQQVERANASRHPIPAPAHLDISGQAECGGAPAVVAARDVGERCSGEAVWCQAGAEDADDGVDELSLDTDME